MIDVAVGKPLPNTTGLHSIHCLVKHDFANWWQKCGWWGTAYMFAVRPPLAAAEADLWPKLAGVDRYKANCVQ